MIYVFIFICVLVYAFFGNGYAQQLGVSNDNLAGAFTYMFVHVSWFHLLVNSFCLHMMYNPIHRLYSKRFGQVSDRSFFVYCVSLSILSAFPAATCTPTIGASGVVYVLLGMLLALNPTLKQLKAYIYIALAILIQLYFGKSNVALHVCAFISGALFIILRTAYDNTRIHIEE